MNQKNGACDSIGAFDFGAIPGGRWPTIRADANLCISQDGLESRETPRANPMNPEASRQSPAVLPHDRFVSRSAIWGDSGGPTSADPSPRPLAQPGWGSGRPVRRLWVMSVLGVFGFLFIANLGVALFVSNERCIYYYDYAMCWDWSREYMSLQSQSALQTIKGVLETIKTRGHNLVPAVPVGRGWASRVTAACRTCSR
jgi:hypothetical protein